VRVSVTDLPGRHAAAWARATRHPFLDGVRDGSVPDAVFDRWLVQDHRFVTDLLRFQARLLGRAPRSAQPVLAAGAVALVDELGWFEELATRRHLDLAADPLPATVSYGRLLDRLDGVHVPVALAMLWALERTYLDAWTYASPGAAAYREYVAHWTTPEFADYVGMLASATDALGARNDLDPLFAEVVDAEIAFWDMAWAGPA
jgi:thiaminase/transcriptional activator TenA